MSLEEYESSKNKRQIDNRLLKERMRAYKIYVHGVQIQRANSKIQLDVPHIITDDLYDKIKAKFGQEPVHILNWLLEFEEPAEDSEVSTEPPNSPKNTPQVDEKPTEKPLENPIPLVDLIKQQNADAPVEIPKTVSPKPNTDEAYGTLKRVLDDSNKWASKPKAENLIVQNINEMQVLQHFRQILTEHVNDYNKNIEKQYQKKKWHF